MPIPNNFDVFKKMCDDNNQCFRLLPLCNIKRTDLRKDHTEIVIGGPRELAYDFMNGKKFVGGLFLIDKEEFKKYSQELSESNDTFSVTDVTEIIDGVIAFAFDSGLNKSHVKKLLREKYKIPIT